MTFKEMMDKKREKRRAEEMSAIKDCIGLLFFMLYMIFGI